MQIAVEKGRTTRPDIKLGICGEHGGDPKSVEFCHELGLSYVSCSPFRVPIARLAAAHAAIKGFAGRQNQEVILRNERLAWSLKRPGQFAFGTEYIVVASWRVSEKTLPPLTNCSTDNIVSNIGIATTLSTSSSPAAEINMPRSKLKRPKRFLGSLKPLL